MSLIEVVDWSPHWGEQLAEVARVLTGALADVPSEVVQQVLEASGEFSDDELAAIRRLNDADA